MAILKSLIVNGVTRVIGGLTASKIIKQGGVSSLFLKADGSVDSTSYYHSGNLTSTIIGNLGILSNDISGNAATATLAYNADTVDGFHASSFYQYKYACSDQNSIYDLRWNYGAYNKGDFNGTYKDEYPTYYGRYLALTSSDKNGGALMFIDTSTSNALGHIYVKTRGAGDWNTTYSEWGTLAYLTDNVASADYATSSGNADTVDGKHESEFAQWKQYTSPDKSYDFGWGMISGGSGSPTGMNYGQFLTMSYRKARGNSYPDYAWQIFGPNGDDPNFPDDIFVRTSTKEDWRNWHKLLHSGNYNSYAPKLDGTGASGTWGINISGDSNTCDGLHVHTGRNNEANKIVRTDESGYIQCGYINSSSGNEGNNSSPARVWGTNGSDSYLRTYLTSALNVGYAASAGNANTVDGIKGTYIFRQIRSFSGASSDNTWIKIQKKGQYRTGTCLISVYQWGHVCSFIFSINNTYPTSSTLAVMSKDSGSLTSDFKLSYSPSEGYFYFKIARDYGVYIFGSETENGMLGTGELVTSIPEDLTECYNISINVADKANSVDWSGVTNKPTKVSEFENDAGYKTTDTTYSTATSNTLGLVKIGYTANNKNYPVQLNDDGKMYVNVPWADTTYNFSGTTFYSGNYNTAEHDANNAIKNGLYYYTSNGPSISDEEFPSDGALYVQSYSDLRNAQIAQDYKDGRLFVRGRNNGAWLPWKKIAITEDFRPDKLFGYESNPDNSHPGDGARVFYSWGTGQANNATSGYSTGITIGSSPFNPNSGFQIVQNIGDDRTYTRRYDVGWKSWKTLAWTSDIPTSLPANGGNSDTVNGQSFSYSNDSNSPTYLWATNSNGTSFLAARTSLSVNYASSAGTVTVTTSNSASTYNILFNNGNVICSNTTLKVTPNTGNVTSSGHFYANSDIRYKNIIECHYSLSDKIAQLPIIKYKWTDRDDDSMRIGSSALSVMSIIPELVSYDNNTDFYSLDYATLGAVAGISACKEVEMLKLKIKELELEIIILKSKYNG